MLTRILDSYRVSIVTNAMSNLLGEHFSYNTYRICEIKEFDNEIKCTYKNIYNIITIIIIDIYNIR